MNEDAVSSDEVRHVAEMARIELGDEEVEQFAAEFETILEAFEALEAVPAVDREAELVNVLRPDETRETLERKRALENAPREEGGRFRGPNVS